MVEEQTRNYELMMIISPEANEVEIDAASARVAGFIADRGGLVYEQDIWGLRRLAYPIQKFHEGNYVLTRFALEPGDVIELDNSLKASDDVMRYLTMRLDKSVKVEAPEPEPEVEAEPEEAPGELVAEEEQAAEAEASEAPVAEVETAEAETDTPDAPVAEEEPVAQAEIEAPAEPAAEAEDEAPAEPVAQAEPEAAVEAETPAEPAAEDRAEA